MARVVEDAKITTSGARADRDPGTHWRGIDPTTHIGYRKSKRGGGGVWLVRWAKPKVSNSEGKEVHGGYWQKAIGAADDTGTTGTLDYYAAVKLARETVEDARREAEAKAAGPIQTVATAIAKYIAYRDEREADWRERPGVKSDANARLKKYVIGNEAKAVAAAPLAALALHDLTKEHLKAWRKGPPAALKATARKRLCNDVKAALHMAIRDAPKGALPAGLREEITEGLQIDAREGQTMSGDGAQPITTEQLLTETEVRALLAAARTVDEREGWGGDLYRMVLVLAATGARYSQACRLTVRDLQPDPCLHVPGSRKGRNADPTQREPVPITPSAYEMLAAATVGRPKRDPLLERWRHVQTEGAVGVWRRDRRGAWAPAELNRPWQLITDEAGIVRDDGRVPTPYWFRHSRIVTMLRAGIPMAVTAKAHNTSEAIIDRHYGKFLAKASQDLLAAVALSVD